MGTLSRRPGPLWVQLFLNSDPAEISQGVLVLLACISMSLLPPPPPPLPPYPQLSSLLSEIFVVCGLPFLLYPRRCGVSVTVRAADFGLRSGCESCVEAEIYHAGATHSLMGFWDRPPLHSKDLTRSMDWLSSEPAMLAP